MKRLTTLFLTLLIVCSSFGQTVLRAYDSNQPLNIETSCEVWLDGKDATTFSLSGTSVDQWDDKSGNDRHVLNGNADATRPTYDASTGRVTFIAANLTFLQSAAFGAALNSPNTVFIVYKLLISADVLEYIFDGRGGSHGLLVNTPGAGEFNMAAGATLSVGANSSDLNNNIHIGLFNGASSSYWINGTLRNSGNAGANALDGITLGGRRTFALYADCEIMEVIVYNASISDVDRNIITGYLSNKWSISATTTYKGHILTAYDSNQPLNIDDECKVWLDGKDDQTFTLDGTSVDNWAGKGSLGINVANTNNDATRPTYDINTGRVSFVAADFTFLQSAAFGAALTQPNTIFIAYKITGAISDAEKVLAARSDLFTVIYINASQFYLYAGTLLGAGPNSVDANDNIHVALFDGGSSEYWINGVSIASGNTGAGTLDGLTLGARGGLSQYADCEIMEVIVYNADISDVDRDKITGYLANKWDILATTDFKGYVLRSWQPESELIFAAMGTTPPYARKVLIDNLVKGLKDDGVWSIPDWFYLLAAHAENSSLLNLINPGTFDATNVHSTAFEIDRGYTGDGSADFLNSNWNPDGDGVNYTLNSSSIGAYSTTNSPLAGIIDLGCNDGVDHVILNFRNHLDKAVGRINDATSYNFDNTDSRGMFISTRTANNVRNLYKNKISIGNDSESSVGLSGQDIYILCENNNGSAAAFTTRQIAAAFGGGGMTQTNVNNFTDRLETYLDAIGAGVISEMMWLMFLLIPNIRRREKEFKMAA